MIKHIPNLLTLGNLLCGTIAVIFAVKADYDTTAILVLLGIVFDFFDGFAARILKVTGELGKQLDSLADMVTSGVVPGIVMFQMIKGNYFSNKIFDFANQENESLAYIGLLLTLGACYRLAKFNIDTRQSDSFIGLPTPAMSLFVLSLVLIPAHYEYDFLNDLIRSEYFLSAITLLLTYLMNAELPLFSLKFKNYNWKGNEFKFGLIIVSIVLIATMQIIAVPVIITVYVLLSVIQNMKKGNA